MKKTSIQTAILAAANLFLLATLIVACQKETPFPVQEIHNLKLQYDTTTGVRYVLSNDTDTKAATVAGDRGGIEGYPWSDGNCRVIFKVRKYFNNGMPEGGDGEPCSSSITFNGYSQPNGQGTLLFSINMAVTGDWQELIIPSSAYIVFIIQQNEVSAGPCLFKFLLADYGWNKNALLWVNIPFNQWLPVITGRYAPKDLTNASGGYTLYDEYLCDSWCTWTVPVYFDNQNPPPLDDDDITGKLLCYYGQNALDPAGQPADSRIIKSYFFSDNHDRTVYFYPISTEKLESYRTEAYDVGNNDPLDVITYDVFGPDGHGAGSFSYWTVAPYPIVTVGKCNVVPSN